MSTRRLGKRQKVNDVLGFLGQKIAIMMQYYFVTSLYFTTSLVREFITDCRMYFHVLHSCAQRWGILSNACRSGHGSIWWQKHFISAMKRRNTQREVTRVGVQEHCSVCTVTKVKPCSMPKPIVDPYGSIQSGLPEQQLPIGHT